MPFHDAVITLTRMYKDNCADAMCGSLHGYCKFKLLLACTMEERNQVQLNCTVTFSSHSLVLGSWDYLMLLRRYKTGLYVGDNTGKRDREGREKEKKREGVTMLTFLFPQAGIIEGAIVMALIAFLRYVYILTEIL